MNELIDRFGPERLAVLAFPSNQFGHQENADDSEILNSLKYVRPGNNFTPKCDVFAKVKVNGSGAHPVFQFLRSSLPIPSDDPTSFMSDPKSIIWSPVARNDVAWNFEKFLIGPDGRPFRRYSKKFETIKLESDIKTLLAQQSK